MQNRPFSPLRLEAYPYRLQESFPVEWLGHHIQGDGDVTHLHFHNCIEIGYCYEGSGLFFVEDQVFPYSRGDALIIFRNQPHLAQSYKSHSSKWHFAFVEPEGWFATLRVSDAVLYARPNAFPHILNGREHPKLVALVEAVMEELEKQEQGYESAVKGLVLSLLVMAGRLGERRGMQDGENETLGKGTGLMRLAPCLEHISRHYMEPIPVGALASLCGVSLTHFRRVFTLCMGMSPLEYIIKVRIQMAATLLMSTDDSILNISAQVGYTTVSSFNRHFKKLMGEAPRDWRSRKGSNY